uniref:VIP36-like protein n=1 Tax=Astatotilapia calliptera TaxID=8154 RepID=A0AAX7TRI7_ASTCA
MKMFGRMMSCCVALLLTFSSVSAVGRALNSITDLRSVGFGQSVNEHSFRLLHWFANAVDINMNGDISLTFGPNSGDYGSHHYRNKEKLLEPPPWGYQYYSLGNIHREGSLRLPHHVFQSEHEYGNRARIIIRVREQNVGWRTSQIIDRVYITQHYETYEDRQTAYDPQHTYEVTTDLLTELRRFSLDRDNINLQSRRVVQENYSSHEYNRRPHDVLQSSQSHQNNDFFFSERYNSNLHFQSQDNNTCVYCFICAVVIVASLVFGLLYLSYSRK